MRPCRLFSFGIGLSSSRAAVAALAVVASGIVGCGGLVGGEAPKTAAQLETQSKVEALVKEGKSLREIRAIMKGEPLPTKKTKKAARKR